jgi:hypothetical protein
MEDLERTVTDLKRRVAQLEEAVRQLGTLVQADVESLRITDAEVTRQGDELTWRRGQHRP